MSFDYGSIDLGLRNPFKLEGRVTAIRGGVISLLGLYLLMSSAGIVKTDSVVGWLLMIFGMVILAGGLKDLGLGIYATLKYFVGRNHPTSLARNRSASEISNSAAEAQNTAYTDKQLEEMLMGRKNTTFQEPIGFLSRLVHTLIPKLLFLPYPIRNLAQRLFGAWVATLVALVSYGFVAFVSIMGFVGEAGEIAFPVYSALLLFYLLFSWRSLSRPIEREAQNHIESLGIKSLVKVIAVSIIMPVIVGMMFSWMMTSTDTTRADIDVFLEALPSLYVGLYLLALLILALGSTAILFLMLRKRLSIVKPVAEVSELRANWQASIHPNEIFINLDNLVMANRRYKEVPNRVYREVDPVLKEQTDGKGSFKGELIHEVQPIVKPIELGELFKKMRLSALILGNVLFVVAAILTLVFAYSLVDVYSFFKEFNVSSFAEFQGLDNVLEGVGLLSVALHVLLVGFVVKIFARLLSNGAHLFFSEIQFESLLVYFKCEGTFTESKISTGMSIHDSTRSENVVVRSSITPWVIASRLTTTVFAATGIKNLEYPRHILSLHKDDAELASIKDDVMSFINDRESIASITSESDLGNASKVHQLNQQSRALPETSAEARRDEESAAGYLKQNEEQHENDSTETKI